MTRVRFHNFFFITAQINELIYKTSNVQIKRKRIQLPNNTRIIKYKQYIIPPPIPP